MKKILLLLTPVILAAAMVASGIYSHTSSAISMEDFEAGNIISDSVFYDSTSMSASKIQEFLDKKVPNCDTQGSGPYGSTTVKEYWTPRGEPAPYTCLKDWKQDTPSVTGVSGMCSGIPAHADRSAAQIISDVSRACGVSPKVLLVLLEKEKALVTDNSPLSHDSQWSQYKYATGFACPDTAPCDPNEAGFFNQVYSAAYQFKLYRANPTNYNYIAGQDNYIQYNPNTSCGGSNVYIENQATAGLYNYTPYQPNKATRDAPIGVTAPCGAYGNKNFWWQFTSWFGSPILFTAGGIKTKHDQLGGNNGSLGAPATNEKCGLVRGGCVQSFENGVIYWTSKNKGQAVVGAIGQLYDNKSSERGALGYPVSGEVVTENGSVYQRFEGGKVYWSPTTGALVVHGGIGNKHNSLGAWESDLGHPVSEEECNIPGGGCVQSYEGGKIVWSPGLGAFHLESAFYTEWLRIAHSSLSYVGYPSSDPVTTSTGTYQNFQSGLISKNNNNEALVVGGGMYSSYSRVRSNIKNVGLPIGPEVCNSGFCSQEFEKGEAYWTSKTGGYTIWGGIRSKYLSVGAENGFLGYPVSDELLGENGGAYRNFENGRIYWKSNTGTFTLYGAIGSKYISIGAEKSSVGYPTSDEKPGPNGGRYQKFEHGRILWESGRSAWVEK